MHDHKNQSYKAGNNVNLCDGDGKWTQVCKNTGYCQCGKAKQKAKIDQVSHLTVNAPSYSGY